MATEQSDPRNGRIIFISITSILAVIGARYALVSYFDIEMGKEYLLKIGARPHVQLQELKSESDKALTGGPMTIDKAMTLVATKPRSALGTIAPKPSDNLAAVEGWSLKSAPAGAAEAPQGAAPAHEAVSADGGAPTAAAVGAKDGGAPTAAPVTSFGSETLKNAPAPKASASAPVPAPKAPASAAPAPSAPKGRP